MEGVEVVVGYTKGVTLRLIRYARALSHTHALTYTSILVKKGRTLHVFVYLNSNCRVRVNNFKSNSEVFAFQLPQRQRLLLQRLLQSSLTALSSDNSQILNYDIINQFFSTAFARIVFTQMARKCHFLASALYCSRSDSC